MGEIRTIPIRFVDDDNVIDIAESLSTIKSDGRFLWLGGDETVSIERTTLAPDGSGFGEHVSYPVTDFLPLPLGPDATGLIPEIDIEGMDR
nr:DUF3616 domain-containing protein [Micromonospora sp. DSM 115978]